MKAAKTSRGKRCPWARRRETTTAQYFFGREKEWRFVALRRLRTFHAHDYFSRTCTGQRDTSSFYFANTKDQLSENTFDNFSRDDFFRFLFFLFFFAPRYLVTSFLSFIFVSTFFFFCSFLASFLVHSYLLIGRKECVFARRARGRVGSVLRRYS